MPFHRWKLGIRNWCSLDKKREGFTLIELLVVISILGLLVGLSLTSYSLSQSKAKDSKRKSDLKVISATLNLYRQDKDSYPTASNFSSAITSYLNPIPTDPKTNSPYIYSPSGCVGNACTSYSLTSCLENGNDSQRDLNKNTACTTPASYTVLNPQ